MEFKFLIRIFFLGWILYFMGSNNLSAQTWSVDKDKDKKENSETKKGRFYLAPDLSFMFGTITDIKIAPALGFYISDRFSIAAGGSYEYFNDNQYLSYHYQTSIWGLRGFARFDLIKDLGKILPLEGIGIFTHAEYEALNLDSDYFNSSLDGKFWYGTFLIGAGLIQEISPKIAFTFMALWDANTNKIALYSNPILKFGFQYYF